MRRIPNFVLLRAFEAAARLESFSKAAAELHLTPSAISHQIKELEQYFGIPLFSRGNRKVTLTNEGRQLSVSLAGIFDTIEAACNEVAHGPQEQVLSVHSAPSFATKWLGPRLPDFLNAHPKVAIRLSSDAEPLDLVKNRSIDALVSYGHVVRRPGLSIYPLGDEEIAPMCAPALAARYTSARDLVSQSPLIASPLSRVPWAEWFFLNGMAAPSEPRLVFDRASMTISAAVDGMGIVLETARLAEDELASGKLVRIGCKEFIRVRRETHFLTVRSAELNTPKITAFVDWLLAAAQAEHPHAA